MSATHTKGTAAQQAAAAATLTAQAFETFTNSGFLYARMPKRSHTGSKSALNMAGFDAAFAGAFLSTEGWVIVCFPL